MARRALFIGVDDYGFAPLTSCVNDAVAMRDAMVELGLFEAGECTLMTSPVRAGGNGVVPTRAAILDWLLRVYDAPPIDRLMVYFAGHGMSVRLGRAADELRTVLVPAGVDRLTQVADKLIDLDELVDRFARFGAKEQFWIIDACRNVIEGAPPNVAPIVWDAPATVGSEMKQGVLYAVAPLGKSRAAIGGHGVFTRCVLDGLRLTGQGTWGGASEYEAQDGHWHVNLKTLCEYASVLIGADLPADSWERDFLLPRAWTSARAPGSLRVLGQLPKRPFVLRVEPETAAGDVVASLTSQGNPLAEWPPRRVGEPVMLAPASYRLSAGLAEGRRGVALAPLAEHVMDVRMREEVVLRVVPTNGLEAKDVRGAGGEEILVTPPFSTPKILTGIPVHALIEDSGPHHASPVPGTGTHKAPRSSGPTSIVVHAADPGARVRLTQLSGGRTQRHAPVGYEISLGPGLWRVELCLGDDVIAIYEEEILEGHHYAVTPMAQLTPATAALLPDATDRSTPTVDTIGPMQGAILPTLLPLLAVKPFDAQGLVLQQLAGRLAIPQVRELTPVPAALALAFDGAWPAAVPAFDSADIDLGGSTSQVWTGAGARIAVFIDRGHRARAEGRIRVPGLGVISAALPRLAGYCTTLAVTLWPDGRSDVSISTMRLPIGIDHIVRPGKLSRALVIASRLAAAGMSLLGVENDAFELMSFGSWGDPVLGAIAWFGSQRWRAKHAESLDAIMARQIAIQGYLEREVPHFTDGRVISALLTGPAALDALLDDPQLEPPVLADAVVALARRAIERGDVDHPLVQRYQRLPRDAVFNVIREPDNRGG